MSDVPTFYADAAQVTASVECAGAGHSFIYAKGPALDPDHPTVKAVQALAQRGLAQLNLGGRDAAGLLQYRVTRLPVAARGQTGGAVADPAVDGPSPEEARVLAFLARQAAGSAFPSWRAIGAGAGLAGGEGGRHRARYLVQRLRKRGLIPPG